MDCMDGQSCSRVGSRAECLSRMSRQDSIGSSLSGWTGGWSAAPGASNFAVVTPPGHAEAFQSHELLVKCPAPKRPPLCSRIPSTSRPTNRSTNPNQNPLTSRAASAMVRTVSRSSLSVLEAAHTASDLVALRRNGSRVQLQRIPSPEDLQLQGLQAMAPLQTPLQRIPSFAEDLGERPLRFA